MINLTLDTGSKFNLIQIASSEENIKAYRSQSPQLIAFAVIGLVYGVRTHWNPTESISATSRIELRELSQHLSIDKVAYETFIASLRRMVRKLCELGNNDEHFSRIKFARNERDALDELLELLASKNIFTASHMRIWAGTKTMAPLDLTRITGDSAKYKREVLEKSRFAENPKSGEQNEFGRLSLLTEYIDDQNDKNIAASVVLKTECSRQEINLTPQCTSIEQIDYMLESIYKDLIKIREEAHRIFQKGKV